MMSLQISLLIAVIATCSTCALAQDVTLELSSPRRMLSATTTGYYSLFAGGLTGKTAHTEVDIFYGGRLVRTDHLSQARGLIAATSLNELAFFAGGQDGYGNKSDVVSTVCLP